MIIGIDLGTSTSEVAYINKDGVPEVIPNHLGENVTPSIVYIDEKFQPIVGAPALEKVFIEPENTFLEVKRLMGTGTKLLARGRFFTPVEISSFILKYLVGCAETHLQEKIDRVVITVPAYFTDAQRRDTIAAGEMIGLKVERIINEPTAASLDYGIQRREDCDYILVYDLGGGTLDVTVLELFEGVVEVKASCGNNELGGKDFDQAIIDELKRRLSKQQKVDVSKDERALARLKYTAEQCKIALSTQNQYEIDLPFLTTQKGNPIGFSTTIIKEEFEALIEDKVFSSRTQIKSALADAKLLVKEIRFALMVGGSTKIPFVKEFLENEIGLLPKNFVDADLAVVRGAAIQAGIIEGSFHEDALVLADVAPYSLSTKVLQHDEYGMDYRACDILIKRNTTIPVSMNKIYCTAADYQTEVFITVYQGESTEPEENILLNGFTLSGIPSKKMGKERIDITFSYDLNGLLVVSGEVLSTGKKAVIEIETSNARGQVDTSRWADAPLAKTYRTVIRKAEKLMKDTTLETEKLYKLKTLTDSLKMGLIDGMELKALNVYKDALLDLFEQIL